ncbi:hypothetical protein L2719_07165 [Shewanella schlegeliana]|uniref:Uncharacterized protein n=1 Tax=Shewanella schlegeliana TaxID=190308 RepID=A0ABS1SXU3_9GAMM|nr:hypothetical protein [Shewanella schlegeliana]MBL4913368.1 hypothetical protein [Shewanella schlegeliana]MCL1109323.1 hypothetical protein [Shewanella schlegeliana]GIU38068.1 hypothetical protein TUM4433_39210 [Shewanella schlegeliana]
MKVNLIADLSMLSEPELSVAAEELKLSWQSNWQQLADNEASAQAVVTKIDDTQAQVRHLLKQLD